MIPEEVTRPVLFQITYFWNRLLGHGMTARDWIESPVIIDGLGHLLEQVHKKETYDGLRVGSNWSMHSKFKPSIDRDGNFYVDVNINFDPRERHGERYEQAENTARLFTQMTIEFLRYCDGGDFFPELIADDYARLNGLLQKGYSSLRESKNNDGKMKFDEATSFVAERFGYELDELQAMNRLSIPEFIYDNFVLEAIVGIEVAKSRSTRALEEMDKEYGLFNNPYSQHEFNVRNYFMRVNGEKLNPYHEVAISTLVKSLPRSKKHIVMARILNELRTENDSVTNTYRENVWFNPD